MCASLPSLNLVPVRSGDNWQLVVQKGPLLIQQIANGLYESYSQLTSKVTRKE